MSTIGLFGLQAGAKQPPKNGNTFVKCYPHPTRLRTLHRQASEGRTRTRSPHYETHNRSAILPTRKPPDVPMPARGLDLTPLALRYNMAVTPSIVRESNTARRSKLPRVPTSNSIPSRRGSSLPPVQARCLNLECDWGKTVSNAIRGPDPTLN